MELTLKKVECPQNIFINIKMYKVIENEYTGLLFLELCYTNFITYS